MTSQSSTKSIVSFEMLIGNLDESDHLVYLPVTFHVLSTKENTVLISSYDLRDSIERKLLLS